MSSIIALDFVFSRFGSAEPTATETGEEVRNGTHTGRLHTRGVCVDGEPGALCIHHRAPPPSTLHSYTQARHEREREKERGYFLSPFHAH